MKIYILRFLVLFLPVYFLGFHILYAKDDVATQEEDKYYCIFSELERSLDCEVDVKKVHKTHLNSKLLILSGKELREFQKNLEAESF